MVAIQTTITIAMLIALLANHQTGAKCCNRPTNTDNGKMCTTTAVGDDRWCCGVGSCNIFCCNCDGGCESLYDTKEIVNNMTAKL